MLSRRQLEPEVMDDPALATDRLHGALTGLTRLNFVSNSARIVWQSIAHLARSLKTDRLRVLDIATGAGDVPITLYQRARRAGLTLDIHGIDVSQRSIKFARERAARNAAPVTFECRNALTDELPSDFDVVMWSRVLRHLSDADALTLLQRMAAATRCLGLVSDLKRGAYGLFLAYVAGHLLTTSDVVHVDAVRSVRAAFTMNELAQMAERARLKRFLIQRKWPARMLLAWQDKSSPTG